MNLKEYSERVLRPIALNAIKSGSCDQAIQLRDVLDFYKDDLEMMQAINDRIKVINERSL